MAIALPFLDAMRRGRRQARGRPAPKRLFTFLNENGVVPSAWFPTGGEKDFKMGVDPEAAGAATRRTSSCSTAWTTRPRGGTCHAAARCGTPDRPDNNGGRARGHLDRSGGRQPHLRRHPAQVDRGQRLPQAATSSTALFYSGPGQMVLPEDDPAKVFARLFSAGVPTPPATPTPSPRVNADFAAPARAQEEHPRPRHGGVQARARPPWAAATSSGWTATWTASARSSAGWTPSGGGGAGGQRQLQAAADAGGGDLGLPPHTKLQSELLTMALACDITRVGSIQTRASLTSFTWLGVNSGQHALSHQQGSAGADAQLNKIATWFAEQVAYMHQAAAVATRQRRQDPVRQHPVVLGQRPRHRHPRRKRYPFLLATGNFTLPDGKLARDRPLPQVPRRHAPTTIC